MIYVAIIRTDSKPGRVFLCTTVTALSGATGIKEGILRYHFGKLKKDYYEHSNPWVEIFVTDEITKAWRPQYKDFAGNKSKEGY